MSRPLTVGLLLLALNSSACGSRAAREALVEATAVTIMAIGAAALDAAAQEQAERDAQRHRPKHVPDEPGAWRLVREYDTSEESGETEQGSANASEADTAATTTPRPVISIGRCMVCQ